MGEAQTVRYRTCSICEANCGLRFEMEGDTVTRITGDPDNLLSRGHICPKGTALVDVQNDPDRLRKPVRRSQDGWEEIEWSTAFEEIGQRLHEVTQTGGVPAIYYGNPAAHNFAALTQIAPLCEGLGIQKSFSASTIDHMPTMLVQYLMYGHGMLFPVVDLDRTQTVLMLGANPCVSNGSLLVAPGIQKRLEALQARGGRLIVIDPRRTETAQRADEHLYIRPGLDAAFLMALLLTIEERRQPGKLEPLLRGWDQAIAACREFDIAQLSLACGIDEAAIRRVASALLDGPSAVYGRIGTSTQAFGTLCAWLIQLINIATGSLDREGGVLFGNPAVDPVTLGPAGSYGTFHSRVSGMPEVMGELPVVTMAEEIATPGDGQIRAFFTYAGNPVLSTPNGQALDAALQSLDLMVSIDIYINETTRHADYILPPCGPLENAHYPWYLAPLMVRNFACYTPPVRDREMGALGDWEIIQGLAAAAAKADGRPVPAMPSPRQLLDDALRASPRGLKLADVEASPHGMDLGPLEPSLPARLRSADGMIDCAPQLCLDDLERLHQAIAQRPAGDGTVLLIGRRQVRSNNSWLHNSQRLAKGKNRCTLMMHPEDARNLDLDQGCIVEIASRVAKVSAPVEISEDIMQGVVSLPHGFGHLREGVKERIAIALQPGTSFNDLTSCQDYDQPSGTAAINGIPVSLTRLEAQ